MDLFLAENFSLFSAFENLGSTSPLFNGFLLSDLLSVFAFRFAFSICFQICFQYMLSDLFSDLLSVFGFQYLFFFSQFLASKPQSVSSEI